MSKPYNAIETAAKLCHMMNRAYCRAIGDDSQLEWSEAPDWQRQSAIKGIEFLLDNPDAKPDASHLSWSKEKLEQGWVYGPVKDAEKKTHPCLVDFEDLPPSQQFKDVLFQVIAGLAMAGYDRGEKGR